MPLGDAHVRGRAGGSGRGRVGRGHARIVGVGPAKRPCRPIGCRCRMAGWRHERLRQQHRRRRSVRAAGPGPAAAGVLPRTTAGWTTRWTRATRRRRSRRCCSARASTTRWTPGWTRRSPEPDPYAEPEQEDNLTVRDELENLDDGEVGDERAGRLIDPNEGIGPDVDKDMVGDRRRHRRRGGQRRGSGHAHRPRRPVLSPSTAQDAVPADRAVRLGPARRRRRSADLLGGVRQPGREAGGVPARRSGRRAASPDVRQLFDPARYRVVLLDQRGCGRSLPHASEPDADLAPTPPGTWSPTWSGCARRGASSAGWSSAVPGGARWPWRTPSSIPDRVTELVLRGIFTLRRSELDFYYNGGAGQLFPERYARVPRSAGRPGLHRRRDRGVPRPAVRSGSGGARSGRRWPGAPGRRRRSPCSSRDPELIAQVQRARLRAGLRPDREPLLHPRRLVRRGPADRRGAPAGRDSRGDRAGPLRRGHPGGHRVRAASGLAAGGPADRFRTPGTPTASPGSPAALVAATDRFAAG